MLGVTGGVISLIGLIAIFVSLNSQHKIQKCREIYWECIDIIQENSSCFKIGEELKRKLQKYANVYESAKELDRSIVFGSRTGIIIVLIIWASLIGIRNDLSVANEIMLNLFLIPIFIVILIFYRILGNLNNLAIIGKLKSTRELLTVEGKHDLRNVLLASNTKFNLNSADANRDTIESVNDHYQNPGYIQKMQIVGELFPPLNKFRIYLESVMTLEEGEIVDSYQIENRKKSYIEINFNKKEHDKNIDGWLEKSEPLIVETFKLIPWSSVPEEFPELLNSIAQKRNLEPEELELKIIEKQFDEFVLVDEESLTIIVPINIRYLYLNLKVRSFPGENDGYSKEDLKIINLSEEELSTRHWSEQILAATAKSEPKRDEKNTIELKVKLDLQHSKAEVIYGCYIKDDELQEAEISINY